MLIVRYQSLQGYVLLYHLCMAPVSLLVYIASMT
ncbi:unnamed protein product [Brugia timori]|uniref:Acyltransferase n=1 Tax=Brugia timori TaxID=42155 RepID=A0A0R3R6Y0_9BILA|nr:unnamed protein product [Brugia timori]